MTILLNETLEEDFQQIFQNEFAGVLINTVLKIAICETRKDYIPIEDFKELFQSMTSSLIDHKIEKFIFDKRELRAFHQPSMEWYFIHWKQELFQHGLKTHRKILPKEIWFRKCVEAGRDEILKNQKNTVLDKLDIKYAESVKEAIAL